MKTALKALLEKHISAFTEEASELKEWPEGLVHDELDQHMSNAAEAVFDATFASSQFTAKEVEPARQ